MPPDMMNVRLVHLLDATERSELMIIYAENASVAGIAGPDLVSGGKGSGRWPAIDPAIVQRAAKRIAFHAFTEKRKLPRPPHNVQVVPAGKGRPTERSSSS